MTVFSFSDFRWMVTYTSRRWFNRCDICYGTPRGGAIFGCADQRGAQLVCARCASGRGWSAVYLVRGGTCEGVMSEDHEKLAELQHDLTVLRAVEAAARAHTVECRSACVNCRECRALSAALERSAELTAVRRAQAEAREWKGKLL